MSQLALWALGGAESRAQKPASSSERALQGELEQVSASLSLAVLVRVECVCWGVGFVQVPRVRGPLSPPCPSTLWRERGHFVILNLFSLSRYTLPFGD